MVTWHVMQRKFSFPVIPGAAKVTPSTVIADLGDSRTLTCSADAGTLITPNSSGSLMVEAPERTKELGQT